MSEEKALQADVVLTEEEVKDLMAFKGEDKDFISDLRKSGEIEYCSVTAESQSEKLALFNAISDPTPLNDMIGKKIVVKDIYMQVIEMTDDKTGEIQRGPAIVLISPEGEAYRCVSLGVYNDLTRIFNILGEPKDWEQPITFEVKNKKVNEKGWTMLKLVADLSALK